jgi:hypothetical protein
MGSEAGGVVTARPGREDRRADDRPGTGLWVGLVLGVPLMAYGAWQLVRHTSRDRALTVGVWVGGGALVHDVLIAPLIVFVVWATGRVLPARYRNAVRTGLLGTALIVALGWPALAGYGNRPDNRSIHPLDYRTAVLTAIGALWAMVFAHILWRRLSTTRNARADRETVPGGIRNE